MGLRSMDNPKGDEYYLEQALKDLKFILQQTEGMNREGFDSNQLLQDAMMFRLIQVSESTSKLTDGFKQAHSHVPWTAVRGLRNRIVHDYGNVDLSIVFNTIKNDIPVIYDLFVSLQAK